MTREEAIENLKGLLESNYVDSFEDAENEALRMAIKALEQEPCTDAISRQAVDTLVDELARAISDERCCISRGRSTTTIIQDILDLPPVNPQKSCDTCKHSDETDGSHCYECVKGMKDNYDSQELKTGHWISFGVQGEVDGQIVQTFTCSECDAISIFRMASGNIVNGDLCPNCGCRMVESLESEVHCNCTDAEIAKSFIEDVEAVKELLSRAESESKDADSN